MPKTKKSPAKKSTTAKASAKKATKAKAKVAPKKATTKVKAKAKTKAKTTKAKKVDAAKIPSEKLELLNETGRRQQNVKPVVERRKRRRQIDPTTCERDYNNAEIEFMQAMDDYKRQSGRMFPTCSEILEVVQKLGYRKIADAAELMYDPGEDKKTAPQEETLDTEYEGEDEE